MELKIFLKASTGAAPFVRLGPFDISSDDDKAQYEKLRKDFIAFTNKSGSSAGEYCFKAEGRTYALVLKFEDVSHLFLEGESTALQP